MHELNTGPHIPNLIKIKRLSYLNGMSFNYCEFETYVRSKKLTFLKENPMLSSFLHFDFETESDEERKVDDETQTVVNLLNKL